MNGRKFTKKEDLLLKNKSLSNVQVARLIGRNPASVFCRRQKLGLTGEVAGSRKAWKSEELDLLIGPKLPLNEIAEKTGRKYSCVYSMYRQLNDHV